MKRRSRLLATLLLLAMTLMANQEPPGEETVYDNNIKVLHVEELKYPPLPRQARIQGAVVVRAKLDSEGKVVSSTAISGHPLLIEVCIPNSLEWRFEPNLKDVVIVYNFRIDREMCYSPELPCPSQFTFRRPNFATITAGAPFIEE